MARLAASPAAATSLGGGGRRKVVLSALGPSPSQCVPTPTFFNEGHGIQLLQVFVTLLQPVPEGETQLRRTTPIPDAHLPTRPGAVAKQEKPLPLDKHPVLRTTQRTTQWIFLKWSFFLHLLLRNKLASSGGSLSLGSFTPRCSSDPIAD